MALPFMAVIGLCVGTLGSGAVVLGGAVATLSLGPAPPTTPVLSGGSTIVTGADPSSGDPVLTPTALGAAQQAAATCPGGLDWALLAGGALVDPALEAGLTTVAADLCHVAAAGRGLALAALMPGPTEGQVALVLADALGADPALGRVPAVALTFAAANIGAPYRWGGTGAGGFDCSGLTQAAYRAAGISIPRVAQDQFDRGPAVPAGSPLEPGDLLFFGGGSRDVSHVGLYIGGGDMIDAPHTGAFVRVEPTPIVPGAHFGSDLYIGATRPGDTLVP